VGFPLLIFNFTTPTHTKYQPIPVYTAKMTLTKLNFITGNKNKLLEVRAILGKVIEVDNQEVDVPEIQGTIEEIAKEKARRAAEAVIYP
jgi:Xanthosine triphosphate pyrophosphatase